MGGGAGRGMEGGAARLAGRKGSGRAAGSGAPGSRCCHQDPLSWLAHSSLSGTCQQTALGTEPALRTHTAPGLAATRVMRHPGCAIPGGGSARPARMPHHHTAGPAHLASDFGAVVAGAPVDDQARVPVSAATFIQNHALRLILQLPPRAPHGGGVRHCASAGLRGEPQRQDPGGAGGDHGVNEPAERLGAQLADIVRQHRHPIARLSTLAAAVAHLRGRAGGDWARSRLAAPQVTAQRA